MNNQKTFGKKVLAFIMVIVFTITPFSYVKADTYTTDDLYNRLTQLVNILNGYTYHDGVNYNVDEIKLLMQAIFDGRYSYMYDNELQQNMTFQQLMQHLVSSNNTILQSIVYGHTAVVDGQPVYTPGLYDKLGTVISELESIASVTSGNTSAIITRLNNIMSDILTINTKLTTIRDYCNTINSILIDIKNADSAFYSYIQNGTFKTDLDNAIDTISWNNYTLYQNNSSYLQYSFDGTNWTDLDSSFYSNSRLSTKVYFKVYFNNTIADSGLLLYIRFPIRLSLSDKDNYSINLYQNNINNLINFRNYYSFSNNYTIDLFFNSIYQNGYYIFEFSSVGTFFSSNNTANRLFFCKYIYDSDIEYWSILSFLDLHRLLLDYESINSTELDHLNQQNQNLTNTIQEFNTVETQITTDFSNNLVTFNSNLNNSTSMLTSLSSTVIWFSTQMQNVFDNVADFKILFIMPMIFGIALWFIGRGGYILRNSVSHDNIRDKVKKGG